MSSSRKPEFGWFCSYTPLEILVAAGLSPRRINGHLDSVRDADTYMSPNMCHYVRSIVDLVSEGVYDKFNGVVLVNSCDAMRRLADVWKKIREGMFFHVIDLPVYQSSYDILYYKEQLSRFQENLESYLGKNISDNDLKAAILKLKQARGIYKDLLSMRVSTPARIDALEMNELTAAFFTTNLDDWIKSTRDFMIRQAGRMQDLAATMSNNPRVLLAGAPMHDPGFTRVLGESGLDLVTELNCTGMHFFEIDVQEQGDLLENLASAYLIRPSCARMMDIHDRAARIIENAKKYNVDGIIHFSLKFCDTYQYDVPELRRILESSGYKILCIEADCMLGSTGQMKTRLEAFKEILTAG
nr:2-hydroxyacyl-CoA dehydratase family protein [Candidatus Sigynarchaeota archaeon]